MRPGGQNIVRGSRVGAGPPGEPPRPTSAARVTVAWYCHRGHVTRACLASTATAPSTWTCRVCSAPAGLDPLDPPPAERFRTMRHPAERTHLDQVRARRSPAEADRLLEEALSRARRN